MIAFLAGATVGAGSDVGSGGVVDVRSAVEPGSDGEEGAEVGPGGAVNAGIVVGPDADEAVDVAPGTAPTEATTGVEAGTASVAEVPQANIPSTTAVRGKASSRDIPDCPPTVQVDG